jgi:hypothetical protein
VVQFLLNVKSPEKWSHFGRILDAFLRFSPKIEEKSYPKRSQQNEHTFLHFSPQKHTVPPPIFNSACYKMPCLLPLDELQSLPLHSRSANGFCGIARNGIFVKVIL